MGLFDSHSHLNDEKFSEDRNKVIKEVYESGVTNFVTAGYNVESSKLAIKIASDYDFIYAIVGISPNDIPQTEDELWKELADEYIQVFFQKTHHCRQLFTVLSWRITIRHYKAILGMSDKRYNSFATITLSKKQENFPD